MHKYIDVTKKYDFSENITADTIWDDLLRLKITNIADLEDDEAYYILSNVLYEDYKYKRANYKCYIEEGMNARMMMELRKSALIPFEKWDINMYAKHSVANTFGEVKRIRMEFFNDYEQTYFDMDWQIMILILNNLHGEARKVLIDYEDCFADATREPRGLKDYAKDFTKAHLWGHPYYYDIFKDED